MVKMGIISPYDLELFSIKMMDVITVLTIMLLQKTADSSEMEKYWCYCPNHCSLTKRLIFPVWYIVFEWKISIKI